ncbi:MAG: hypothetical protein CME33_01575 [Gimesia sp.]|nr:hypothetical protein [Gimesia sp.]|tara:strand:+ start:295 stop:654 length:360 start_codon:yes stop_codon:yes gene_type:complete
MVLMQPSDKRDRSCHDVYSGCDWKQSKSEWQKLNLKTRCDIEVKLPDSHGFEFESLQHTRAISQINFSTQRVNIDARKKSTKNKFVFFSGDNLPNIDIHVENAVGKPGNSSSVFQFKNG